MTLKIDILQVISYFLIRKNDKVKFLRHTIFVFVYVQCTYSLIIKYSQIKYTTLPQNTIKILHNLMLTET